MIKRFTLFLFVCASLIFADEGMWLMTQIDDLGLKEKGFTLPADSIYHPGKASLHNAIVWLGGCSASFVSPDGLVLTNHHCAYGALQRASAQDSVDYIRNGFLAQDRSEELPAPGQYAYVLREIEDVTRQVIRSARFAGDLTQREKSMMRKCREIEEETEGGREDVRCKVVKLFEGREYRKYVFTKYHDVRIVYAPPASIGKYGGDTDNWMWPRHTGDFTFLRVYQSPDGEAAEYSETNVPLNCDTWLRVADEDLSAGDPAFILGFPGRTTRYRTSRDVEYTLNKFYIPRIDMYEELLGIMEEVTEENPQGEIRLASLNASINNMMKKYQGNVDGMLETGFIERKKAEEDKIRQFIASDRRLNRRYADLYKEMFKLIEERASYEVYDDILDSFGYYSGLLYYLADYAYEVAREREKPEADRDPEFSETRVKEFVKRIPYRYLSFYEPYDKRVLLRALRKAESAPDGFHFFELPEDPGEWVESAYAESKLKDAEFAQEIFSMSASEIEDLNDPVVQLAVSLYAPKFEKRERNRNWSAHMNDLRQQYIEVLDIYYDKPLYPDATGTLRFTYGTVKGYQPRDAVWYLPFTTLSGVIAKNTGEAPFDMPEKLAELKRSDDLGPWTDPELEDVPCCFLMTGDITNGNSGSAVMNRHGELIGLAFDGNYEAMTSDWRFQEAIQRAIVVDIRYVLFVTRKFAGAQRILDEMGM